MDCLNCGNYATKFYVSDDGTPCFLCTSCADAWELGYWYGQNHPETYIDRVAPDYGAEETPHDEPLPDNRSQNSCHDHHP